MLGVPASHGVLGWAAIFGGIALASALAWLVRARIPRDLAARAGIACLLVSVAALPYGAWRIGEDLRHTTRLHGYDRAAAGPVQTFLPGYLLDGVVKYIPRSATYATLVGNGVPWPAGRAAFPSLALQTLFPRVSEPIERADYVVGWGVSAAELSRRAGGAHVIVARPRVAQDPPVLVAEVRR
jgi:hypothetical protein